MDLQRVEEYCRLIQAQPYISEITIEGTGWSLSARRGAYIPPAVSDPEETGAAAQEPISISVYSDRVGTYRAPEHPLTPGSRLNAGDPVGSIIAMRIENPLVSEHSGVIESVRVEDGDPIEYGQLIVVLRDEVSGPGDPTP